VQVLQHHSSALRSFRNSFELRLGRAGAIRRLSDCVAAGGKQRCKRAKRLFPNWVRPVVDHVRVSAPSRIKVRVHACDDAHCVGNSVVDGGRLRGRQERSKLKGGTQWINLTKLHFAGAVPQLQKREISQSRLSKVEPANRASV
jgi:hypothetical protein